MKNITEKYLLIGPIPGVITGQSLAFSTLVKNSTLECIVVNDNSQGFGKFGKVLRFFKVLTDVFLALIKSDVCCVYLSCTRTKLGSVKDILILLFARLFNIRKVCIHLHGMDMKEFRLKLNFLHRLIFDFSYRKATDLILLHKLMEEQFDFLPYSIQRHVVPNFYEEEINSIEFDPLNFKSLKVLYLSNMMETKGIKHLVDAATSFIKSDGSLELKCAGAFINDTCAKDNLKTYLSDKWCDDISYVGTVTGQEKLELLKWANILIIPSFYPTEAFPLCILEGMAAGCYVVVTDHNILSKVVDGDFGSIIKKQSTESIVKEFNYLNKNLERVETISKHNFAKTRKFYTVSTHVNKLEKIFKS